MLMSHRLKVHRHIWNQACSESWELHERNGRQSNRLGLSPRFATSMLPLSGLDFFIYKMSGCSPRFLPSPTCVGLGRARAAAFRKFKSRGLPGDGDFRYILKDGPVVFDLP